MKNRDKNTKLPLFENIDCIHIRVADLDSGLEFYQNALGLNLLWRTKHACGLGMKTGDTEIVISKEDYLMVDVKVENVGKALTTFVNAGGEVKDGPFDIDVGKCAVVADAWGNQYCLLDTTKGTYDTDADNLAIGVSKK